MKHLIDENLLSSKQYGFISGRSTTLQLLNYIDKCVKTIAEGGVINTIYFDFAKAFDSVPHRRLISKLESYGISGSVLNWIKNYLNERQQTVSVNGEKSDPVEILSGVPQGTVLGPLLFVLYINDILDNTKSHGFMFADDTKLFRQVTSKEDALVLQSDINLLDEWSKKWLLSFNKSKCHVLTLGKLDDMYAHRYTVADYETEHVFQEKDLGVTVDSALSFEEHISKKVKTANSIVGLIRRSFSFLDAKSFVKLFTAFVRPHLEYAVPAWDPHLQKHIDMLENVQVRATRLVDSFGKLEYHDRLKRLNLPTLIFRRKRGAMIELYKHFHAYDKNILAASFQPSDRTSRKHAYQLREQKPKDGVRGVQSNAFYYRWARTWNDLPRIVVDAENLNIFKNRLDEAWKGDTSKFDHKA